MRLEIQLWNGDYYYRKRAPDGTMLEVKSPTDLTFIQAKTLLDKAWTDSQIPDPVQTVTCPFCKKTFPLNGR